MDMGTAVTCSVAIATFGGLVLAFLRFFRNRNGVNGSKRLNDKGFVNLEGLLRKEFVSEKTCIANIKAIETSINSTKELLSGKIDGLNSTLDTGLKNLRREMVKANGP